MKRIFVAVVLLTLLLVPVLSYAENYNDLPEKFFTLLKKGKPSEAIDFVYGTNKWMSRDADQMINLKNQLTQVNKLVGHYLFNELIMEGKTGNHYVHLIYLVGYERQPLRFELKLYKPKEEWIFFGISFDTKLTDQIEKQSNEKLVQR